MKDYQIRVLEEKNELDARISRLENFVKSETFVTVVDSDKDRLTHQLSVMKSYSAILGERIARFN